MFILIFRIGEAARVFRHKGEGGREQRHNNTIH